MGMSKVLQLAYENLEIGFAELECSFNTYHPTINVQFECMRVHDFEIIYDPARIEKQLDMVLKA
jgi:hypothetical protein